MSDARERAQDAAARAAGQRDEEAAARGLEAANRVQRAVVAVDWAARRRRVLIALLVAWQVFVLTGIGALLLQGGRERDFIHDEIRAHGCRTRQEFRATLLALFAITEQFGGTVPRAALVALPRSESCPDEERFDVESLPDGESDDPPR